MSQTTFDSTYKEVEAVNMSKAADSYKLNSTVSGEPISMGYLDSCYSYYDCNYSPSYCCQNSDSYQNNQCTYSSQCYSSSYSRYSGYSYYSSSTDGGEVAGIVFSVIFCVVFWSLCCARQRRLARMRNTGNVTVVTTTNQMNSTNFTTQQQSQPAGY